MAAIHDPQGGRVADDPHGRLGAAPLILVADDDLEMRALLKRALQKRGYLVEVVANGLSILQRVSSGVLMKSRRPPDLIISDIRMPGLTGLEVLEAIQTLPEPIPVILITSFGDPETYEAARQLGAVTLLDKPFSQRALEDAVSAALAQESP